MKKKKINTLFMILLILFLVDFSITSIILNTSDKFVERNPVTKFFLDKGLYGSMAFFVFAVFGLYLISYGIHCVSYNKYNKNKEVTFKVGMYTAISLQLIPIINGLYWIT